MENIIVNKLPAKTWYWLNVNEAKFEWDKNATIELEKTIITSKNNEPVKIDVTSDNKYSEKYIDIIAEDDSELTVYMNFKADNNLAVHTNITVGNNAKVKLVQLNCTNTSSLLYNEVKSDCKPSSRIEAVQVFLGKGDVYSDFRTDLIGDKSSLKIDFKKGSCESVGNEQENVLLLGDDIINKTIPLILCAEENVVGNHGASIGELDDDTLFYFESRGIDKTEAENIMAKASIERLTRLIDDETITESIEKELKEVL